MAGFLTELKRRNVFRVGAAYVLVAWLVIQVIDNLVPLLAVPQWVGRAIFLLLVAGLPVALVIAWAFELTPEGVKRTANAAAGAGVAEPPARSAPRRWDWVIIVGLAIALGVTIWDRLPTRTDSPAMPASAASQERDLSIGVLPFLNLSSDREQEYFSDGLAEELLNKLAKIERLRVAARTSSFALKGSTDNVQTMGDKLGVAHILEGSVRKSGDQLRITAQLIDVADGYHLWSETYDRRLDDVFAIQEEIATAVAEALSITLGVAERERLKTGTRNLEAYDHYLAGLSLLNEFGPTQTERGVAEIRLATELDSDYADAWGVLAASAIQLAYTFTNDFARAERDAAEAATRALELNPNLTPAHAALAHVRTLRKEWAQADQGLRKALEFPSDYVASWDYAQFLHAAGYLEEAREYRLATRQAMPLNVAPAVLLASTYHALGDDARSEAELESAKTLVGEQSGIRRLRVTMAMARRDTEAIRYLLEEDLASTAGTDPAGTALLALLGTPATAPATLRALAADAGTSLPQQQRLATWAAYYGDDELAVELIRSAALQGPHHLTTVWAPVWRDARRTAEFKDLLRELKLVDFWRTRGWPTFCRLVENDDFECF